jgi:transcriptional regulator with PAS, ATPase and Fis domain
MQAFENLIRIAAPSAVPVLLLGESGCGKEVAARNLHLSSPRRDGPFIAVNCGALSPGLLESLLCGPVRGAFTGADREQSGFVRAAEGGTLFLDELGELPPEAQSRLLRILQEKCVTPVGSQQEIPVDFRLVCATHRDLENSVRQGFFRQDLYFRIAVFPIRLPALRDRREEFSGIAAAVWSLFTPDSPLSANEISELLRHPWPGNIRQLRNVLERYSLLRNHGVSLAEILAPEPQSLEPFSPESYELCEPLRSDAPHIAEALRLHGNNKTRAARALGISRGSFRYQLEKQRILYLN